MGFRVDIERGGTFKDLQAIDEEGRVHILEEGVGFEPHGG